MGRKPDDLRIVLNEAEAFQAAIMEAGLEILL
jgi:hypothetical protein